MTNIVSIIKCEGGIASYRIVESGFKYYTAYLVRNTATEPMPQEVTIDRVNTFRHQEEFHADPLMQKLVTAIRVAEMDGDGAV